MKIKNELYKNLNSFVLESKVLRVVVLPELGFKTASIVYKPKDKEFLFQPSKDRYEIPHHGAEFEKYDTSGLDEMLPTIDKCDYPEGTFQGRELPDHGDVWSLPWDVEVKDNIVTGSVNLISLPLEFQKSIGFENDNTIRMDYKVKNLSDENVYYLWALHGLNVFDNNTEFIFASDMDRVLNVHNDEDLNLIDLKCLKNYEDKKTYKYYFQGELETGRVGLNYTKERIKYMINYDTKVNPYLGVWITKGGFKGEYNCALEPSNGFYDTVSLAYENRKIPFLNPYEEHEWTIFIDIDEY